MAAMVNVIEGASTSEAASKHASGLAQLEALREVEIAFESLQIAGQSSNTETAKSRLTLAAERWEDVQLDAKRWLSAPELAEANAAFDRMFRAAQTSTALRQIIAGIERAQKLKTIRGQKKHIDAARAVYDDACLNPFVDGERVAPALDILATCDADHAAGRLISPQ